MSPDQWSALFNVTVLDPDGWRTPDAPAWETPISEVEFRRRLMSSTIRAYGYPGTAL